MTKGNASHCCGPRWNVYGSQSCAKAPDGVQRCGSCCQQASGYNLTKAPCLPALPVIPENGGRRAASVSDPCEVVGKSIVGDSFPDSDYHYAPEGLSFGMGQWAKYMYVLPSANLTVVSMGQSKGGSLDCQTAYNDGYTLSLIWRVMEEALGVGPKGMPKNLTVPPPVPASELPRAGVVGTPRPGGDRTRESIRAEKAAHEAAAAALESSGEAGPFGASCTCVCPPEQGFGQCFNIPQATARKHPFVREGGACPMVRTNP